MNTTLHIQQPAPPEAAAWARLLRLSRRSDRCIARALCRNTTIRRTGGLYPGMGSRSDSELAAELGLSARQVQRLRSGGCRLWRWCGDTLQLAFASDAQGRPTALRTEAGQRAARDSARRTSREPQRPLPPYPDAEEEPLMAAEEE